MINVNFFFFNSARGRIFLVVVVVVVVFRKQGPLLAIYISSVVGKRKNVSLRALYASVSCFPFNSLR